MFARANTLFIFFKLTLTIIINKDRNRESIGQVDTPIN